MKVQTVFLNPTYSKEEYCQLLNNKGIISSPEIASSLTDYIFDYTVDDLQSENIPSLELLKKMVKKEDITVQKEIIQVLIEHYDKRVADYQSQYGYYGKRAINQVKQQGWFECLRAQKVFQLLYRILTGEDFVSFYGSIFFNQVSNLDEQALF